MPIRVKDLQGTEYSIPLYVGGNTVLELKKQLQSKSGISQHRQRLIYNNEILESNGTLLSHYGITDGVCLQLVVMAGWIIRINNLHNPGQTIEVFLKGHDCEKMTVMDLKKEIAKIQGEAFMKLNEIRLMKNSQEPRDITTLRDARIVDNDTLSIKKKCFPPMNVLVAGYNAKTHNIVITRDNPEETTIAELKKKVEEKTGVRPEEQRLCFGSKPLLDHHKFEDLGIGNGSTIFLLARLKGGAAQGMIALLRESPTNTINNVPHCPIYRACPHCGTLLEHTGGCNNFTCHCCKKNFCFICLSLGDNGRLSCAGRCLVASRQTYIVTR
ncbi:PREDICTED: polyubiquitin-like [Amphimedon queenslandica]|uniref:Ubiquitin-like domain-containing protein n=1 Tax=Amphimedon queenslandica TaxID=400682 RepID=A0A1X7VA13_AMPQE|nr:PREDICTED: polyubiquitin-like [Amphimedon queenslandica]XP_019849907.1 PREDICTED: polyubiquitin-like [Amphimedon queenslandica]|eukprot:XP_019849906.1 PREDICTED: polyubiquitin-like [Amphimedon queenslandica]